MYLYKKLRKENILVVFLIQLLIILLLTLLFCIAKYHESVHNSKNKSAISNFYKYINNIQTENNRISIIFDENYTIQNFKQNSRYFILQTNIYDKLCIFDYRSFYNTIIHQNKVSFSIYLPFIQQYNINILFFDKQIKFTKLHYEEQYLQSKKHIIHKHCITLNAKNITFQNEKPYSQMKCYANDSPGTRWCEMYNVAFIRSKLVFSAPFLYAFPEFFMTPGARAPPYDRPEDRFEFEPILTHANLSNFHYDEYYSYDNLSYIMGRFYNSMMLWHILFDFSIPAYETINKVENGRIQENQFNRTLFLKDNEFDVYNQFINIFSNHTIRNIVQTNTTFFFSRVIVGMIHFEEYPSPFRRIEDHALFKYNMNETSAVGYREFVLKNLNIDEHFNHTSPEILIIERKDKRDILNIGEIIQFIKNQCNYCNICTINFRKYSVDEQVGLVSKANAIVGLHGSGLAHVMWLASTSDSFPTALFEIKPYNYWCRDWYEVASKVANVQYMSVMNVNKPTRPGNQTLAKYCYSTRSRCLSIRCHDFIRDVGVNVELSEFEKSWKPYQSQLDRAFLAH